MTLKKYYASELQATEPVYLAADIDALLADPAALAAVRVERGKNEEKA